MKKVTRKFNLEIVLLCLILVFGLFLRLYSLGNAPLWVDESISSETAKNIVEKGVPVFDSGFVDGRAYVFHYLQAFFILIFGASEFWLRFVSVIFGILIIILGYRIGKEYSRSGGLITALCLAVFYLEVFYSRQARMYQAFQLLFFLSLYLLYKSRYDVKYLYFAIVSFLICLDTQLAGLILAPFFILHILIYNRKSWYLALIPLYFLIEKFFGVAGLSSDSAVSAINYASSYLSYTTNMNYLLILFIPGLIWAFMKKKELTAWIVIPSLFMLAGVFSLQTFALRYGYFFVFPIVLYSSLLISFLYDKYGKIILIALVCLLIIPSNIIFPATYVNVIRPIDYNFNDASAPFTDYRALPLEITRELQSDTTLISLFSLDLKYYVRSPDYVIPFSLNGIGEDQVSKVNLNGEVVDWYSGARILNYSHLPIKPYNVVVDSFSSVKLTSNQAGNLTLLIENCSTSYAALDLKIYSCK